MPIDKESPEQVVQLALDGWYPTFMRTLFPNWLERSDDLQSLLSFASRYETMQELLAQLVLLSAESNERSPDDQKHCLRLTTVHQAKGLEFPIVFVIGLSDGLFPLKRTIDDGDVTEERRLFYVAATRAKEALYLTYPMLNQQGNSLQRLNASRFVQEIPEPALSDHSHHTSTSLVNLERLFLPFGQGIAQGDQVDNGHFSGTIESHGR
jgi:DNA helicase-2/ATP-dependent DNA helicase PcrA